MRILRGLTSHVLPCRCVAGVYETYDGDVITLLDERDASCAIETHQEGNQIPDLAVTSKVALHAKRKR